MTRRLTKMKATELGSSTLEFIFCAPILLIVMFVAMEINERIEHRVAATIAAGNATLLIKPDASAGALGEVEAITKGDILGAYANAGEVRSKNGQTLQSGQTVLSYSDAKLKTDSYDVQIARTVDNRSQTEADQRAGQKIGNSTLDRFAVGMSGTAASLMHHYRKFTNGLMQIFPEKPIERTDISWSTSTSGTTNLAMTAIEDLAQGIGSSVATDLPKMSSHEYRLLAHKTRFLKRDAAYHNNDYQMQALYGIPFGESFDDDFVSECFLNFKRDTKAECGENNGFYSYVEGRHNVIATAKTVISCTCFGLDCLRIPITRALIEGVKAVLTSMIEGAITSAVTSVVDQVQNEVAKQISTPLEEPQKILEAQIEKQTDRMRTMAKDAMEKALE